MGAGHDGLLTAQGDVHRRQVCLHSSQLPPFFLVDIPSAGSWYHFYFVIPHLLFRLMPYHYRTKPFLPLTSSPSFLFSAKRPNACAFLELPPNPCEGSDAPSPLAVRHIHPTCRHSVPAKYHSPPACLSMLSSVFYPPLTQRCGPWQLVV
jgi:hypothetical protein